MASIHDYQWWITDASSLIFTEERGCLYIGYIPGINFMYSGAVDLLQIRYAIIFAWFCPCSIGWFWPIFYFLCETSTWHLYSCSPEDTWYGVILWVLRVLGQGLNQSARIFFTRAFSSCYAILTSPKDGETAVYGYNPALFWVLSVSCWCLAELIAT